MTTPSADGVNRKVALPDIALLESQETPERLARIRHALSERTRNVCLVLEDIFQAHNAAACCRSCEAFGVQDVHFIVNRNDVFKSKRRSTVSMGSDKWLTLQRWGEKCHEWNAPETAPYAATQACLTSLKEKGYRIVATTLRADSVPPERIPCDRPVALLIGSEERGLSDTAHRLADMAVQIPMRGFVQSLNLSVCAALLLRALVERVRAAGNWQLSDAERDTLYRTWLLQDTESPERPRDFPSD